MAAELQVGHAATNPVYALVRKITGATIRDVVAGAWDTYATGDIGDYDVQLTEQGTASDWHVGDFPSGIEAGSYRVSYYEQASGSADTPAEGDTLILQEIFHWNGSTYLSRAAWAHISVQDVPEARRWTVEPDGRVAPTLVVSTSDSGTFAMDFGRVLDDNETSFLTADSVSDISGNALAVSNVRLHGNKRQILFDVAAGALGASTTYKFRCVGTSVDGVVYSADGSLQTRE